MGKQLHDISKPSSMTPGDYLRWLASTFGGEPSVKAELLARAEQVDSLYGALERLERSMQAVYGDADSHLSGAAGGEGDPKVIRSYVRAALSRAKGGV